MCVTVRFVFSKCTCFSAQHILGLASGKGAGEGGWSGTAALLGTPFVRFGPLAVRGLHSRLRCAESRLAARALAAAHASFPSRLLPAAPTADAERSVSSPVEPTREPSGSRV